MKTRILALLSGSVLLACHSPMPEPANPVVAVPNRNPVANSPGSSSASTLDAYKADVARHIEALNNRQVYSENPQALLRAVIVLRYALAADGRLLSSEIVRSNHDREAENIALASLKQSTPFPRPDARLLKAGKLIASETWLFNNDGRFQLRSIALPQLSE